MNFFRKPSIESSLTYLVLAAVLLTMTGIGYFFFGGLISLPLVGRGGEGDFKLQALILQDRTVEFTHTDDNSGEDIIIFADKREYYGNTSSEVFIALTPLQKQAGENISMQFLFPRDGATVDEVELYADGIWKNLDITRSPITGISKKSIPEDYRPVGYAGFVSTGGTQYFRALISYPEGAQGEFWIEALGDRGSYGLLDPTYISARAGSALSWYNSSWGFRKKITIDPAQVKGGLTNFPMLFSRTDADLKDTANGGNVASSTAGDIVFTDWDGIKIDHEIERYTSTTGQFIAWVEVPFVSSTSTRGIYMYYGNASAAYQPTNAATWDSNYKGVWHLPNGTTLTAADSTSNGHNGTLTNSPTATGGVVNGSANFIAASSKYITMGTGSGLDLGTSDYTISAWISPPNSNQFGPVIARRHNAAPFEQYGVGIGNLDGSGNKVSGKTVYNVLVGPNVLSTAEFHHTTSNVADGGWHYIVATRTGNNVAIYVDGVSQALTVDLNTEGTIDTTGTNAFNLAFENGTSYYEGLIDEARVSNALRSAAWIATEYNNQKRQDSFFGVGGQEAQTRSSSIPTIKSRGGIKLR